MREDHFQCGSKGAKGFSAVEFLIAASLIAVALLAIASLFPTAYGNIDVSGEQTMLVTLANQRIEWLRTQAYTSSALAAGTTTESLTGTAAGHTRTTVIQDNTPVVGVKQVTVTVTTPTGLRSVQLTTLIAK